jgi:hypothetical protein
MRFEKKDIALLIPATLLAVAGLGPDDLWVVGPCLFISWIAFIVICIIHEGPRSARAIVGVVITVALFGVGYRRFDSINRAAAEMASKKDESKPGPRREETKKEPSKDENLSSVTGKRGKAPLFAIQVESVGISPHPKSETEVTGFYVAYIANNQKTLSPARMFMFLRITNLQDHPVMIAKYYVRIGKIKMIKISGPPTESFYDGHGDIHGVCWINDSDLLDKNLEASNLQPRVPVQGLALFDYPEESRPANLDESNLAAMRFTITIVDTEGRSFTSEALQPRPDPLNANVQSRIVRFNRGTRDLAAFKIKDFTVSSGFTSPPF